MALQILFGKLVLRRQFLFKDAKFPEATCQDSK